MMFESCWNIYLLSTLAIAFAQDNESLKQTAFLKAFDPHFVDELFKVLFACQAGPIYIYTYIFIPRRDNSNGNIVALSHEVYSSILISTSDT